MANEVCNRKDMKECYQNYVLVDVGANLINKKFGRDLDSVINRAKEAGVQKIIVPSSSIKRGSEALRLTRIYPDTLYATAGLHPFEAKSWNESTFEEIKAIAMSSECVAIGECGLDYNKDFTLPDTQRDVFRKQIQLACQLKKPLYVIERNAHEDFIKILNEFKSELPPVVLQSFSGNSEHALKYLEMGMYICITGNICKDNTENSLRSLLETGKIQLDRILIQSSSPFLYPNARSSKLPVTVKDSLTQRSLTFLQRYCTFQRNEPCSLPIIVEMVAAFLQKSAEDVALATAFNALKIFGLN